MKFTLFFVALFVIAGCLLGAPVHNPFPNFGAVIIVWFHFYLLTLPGRRRRSYWRERRHLQEQCMRTYLRNNGFHY